MPRSNRPPSVRLTPDGPDLIRATIENGPHTQAWWADKTGLTQGTISNLVNRRLLGLSADTAKRLTDALNLHFGDVFEVIPPK